MRRLVLVRHGDTAYNEENKLRSWRDVPLNVVGIQQAKDVAAMLPYYDVDGLVTSDLSRAANTAKIISRYAEVPILGTTNKLRPWNLGYMTGQNVSDLLSDIQYYVEHPGEAVPEGESFESFQHRFMRGIALILSQFPSKVVAAVTHHRGERLLQAWDAAGQPQDYEIDQDVFLARGAEPGSIMSLSIDDDLSWVSDL